VQAAEAEYKSQLDALKAAALQANNAALQSAATSAAQAQRPEAAAGADLAGLRSRLEGAIAAMQQGLVERDTEVGLLCCV
jgi:hypothetical protein